MTSKATDISCGQKITCICLHSRCLPENTRNTSWRQLLFLAVAPLQQRNSSQKPSQINRSTILSVKPLLLCTVWFRTHCPCLTLLCLPMPSASSSAPGLGAIFGRKALGFRSSVDSTASWRMMAFSTLLQQLVQLQLSQCRPEAKHSAVPVGSRGTREV